MRVGYKLSLFYVISMVCIGLSNGSNATKSSPYAMQSYPQASAAQTPAPRQSLIGNRTKPVSAPLEQDAQKKFPFIDKPFISPQVSFQAEGLNASAVKPADIAPYCKDPNRFFSQSPSNSESLLKQRVKLLLLIESQYRYQVAVNKLSDREKEKIINEAFNKHLNEEDAEVNYGGKRRVGSALKRVFNSKGYQESKRQQLAAGLQLENAPRSDLVKVLQRVSQSLIDTFLNRPLIPAEEAFQSPDASNKYTPAYMLEILNNADIDSTVNANLNFNNATIMALLIQRHLSGEPVHKMTSSQRKDFGNYLFADLRKRLGYATESLSPEQSRVMLKYIINAILAQTNLDKILEPVSTHNLEQPHLGVVPTASPSQDFEKDGASIIDSGELYPPMTKEVWDNFEKSSEAQFRNDAIILFHTLFPQKAFLTSKFITPNDLAYTRQTIDFLKRLIIVIAYKGLSLTPEKNGKDVKAWPHSIASIFGHGGRLMITLENAGTSTHFINYLATGDINASPSILKTRQAASHAMKYLPQEKRYIEEKLGVTQTPRNLYYGMVKNKHLGIDIAWGGVGNPLNDTTIWVGGSSLDSKGNLTDLYLGHLYIFLDDYPNPLPNNETRSGVLIGLEQSGPGRKNAWGRAHTAMSGFHDSSVLRGVTGGNKWEKLDIANDELKPNNLGGKVLILQANDYSAIDNFVRRILALDEQSQKQYFWYIINSTPSETRQLFLKEGQNY